MPPALRSLPPPLPTIPGLSANQRDTTNSAVILPHPHMCSLSLLRLVETREVRNKGGGCKKTGRMREVAEKAAERHVKMLWRGGYHDIWAACRGCLNNKTAKTKCCKQGLFATLWQSQTKGYESRVGRMVIKQKTACLEDSLHPHVLVRPSVVFSLRGRPTSEPDDPPAERSKWSVVQNTKTRIGSTIMFLPIVDHKNLFCIVFRNNIYLQWDYLAFPY